MLELPLQPFLTPNFVLTVDDPPLGQHGTLGKHSFPLSTVSAEKLSKMCDEFRAKIFEKAGKKDPKIK